MSSTYGENLKLTIFGQSHGPAIGMTMDGIPAGLPVDLEELQRFLNRRAPGQNDWSTPRREEDRPEILSGLVDGFTCEKSSVAVQIAGVDGFPMKSIHLKNVTAKAGVNVQTDFVENLCMENVTFK
jgi:chorismate synthase